MRRLMLAALALNIGLYAGQRRIDFAMHGDTAIGALMRMSSSNEIPLGLIGWVPGSRTMCEGAKDQLFDHATPEQILAKIIDGSKYKWDLKRGVIHVGPLHVPPPVEFVLRHSVPPSSSPSPFRMTMSGWGVVLSGWMTMALHPGEGVIGDILGNPDEEQIEISTKKTLPLEAIADLVVSQHGKGVWFAYPNVTETGQQRADAAIEIFSYVHNESSLKNAIGCTASSK